MAICLSLGKSEIIFPLKILFPKSLYILLRMLSIPEVGKVYPHVPAVLFFSMQG